MRNLLLGLCLLAATALSAQQPQTSTNPIYRVNAQVANGTAPGYWPTAGSGLTLNISAGTAFCNGSIVTYAAGTLSMTNATTNRVYLNTSSSCVPSVKTTAYATADIPIATVVTSGGAITTITDNRTFQVTPGAGGSGITSFNLDGDNNSPQTIVDGNELLVAGGNGIATTASATDTVTVAADLLTAVDSVGATSSNSGLEFGGASGDKLSLLQGCADGQLPKWEEDTDTWDCANDNTGAGGGYATIDNENTPLTQRTTLNFVGAGINCADDTDQTTCTISGGGGATDDSDVAVQVSDTGSVATTQHEINQDRPMMPIDFGGRTAADIQNAIDAMAATGDDIRLPCGTYALGATTLQVAAGDNGVRIRGASLNCTIFTYTGSTRAVLVGGTGALTERFLLEGVTVDISGAGDAAVGVEMVRPWWAELRDVKVLGPNGSANPTCQTGIKLDGGDSGAWGNYNLLHNVAINGDMLIGIHFTGAQPGGDSMNSNQIIGGSMSMNASSKIDAGCTQTPSGNSIGLYLEDGQQNFVYGLDIENYHYGTKVDNHDNWLSIRYEGNTQDWTTGASANGNSWWMSNFADDPDEDNGSNTSWLGNTNGGQNNARLNKLSVTGAAATDALEVLDGRYFRFGDNNAGAPAAGDCNATAEIGRMSIDTSNNRLYICNGATRGWDYVALTD